MYERIFILDEYKMDDGQSHEEKGKLKVEFKIPLLIVKTQAFLNIFDRLGSSRAAKPLSWAAFISMPIIAGFGIYLISTAIFNLLTIPAAQEASRELGLQAYILIPGLNPYLPILFGWIGIVVGLLVHEGAHGFIARHLKFRVESSGLLFFLVIPIGAFVDVDEEQLKQAKAKNSIRVLAAGPGANAAVGLACIFGVLLIVGGLTPVIDGLYIVDVMDNMPASNAGIQPGNIIVKIDDQPVTTLAILNDTLKTKSPGDTIQVTVAQGEHWSENHIYLVKLAEHEGKSMIGVYLNEMLIEQRLSTYRTLAIESPFIHFLLPTTAQWIVPYSDSLSQFYTHDFIVHWNVLAKVLFWIWFININLAIFNALPIVPLDGGYAFRNALRDLFGSRINKRTINFISKGLTLVMVFAIVLMIFIPYIF